MNKLPQTIEQSGFGITEDIGGLPRTTYYTPDGRTIRAIPSLREYAIRNERGKVIRTGTRDANLDRGWLLAPPTELKLYCRHCDKWHDTQEEIEACSVRQNRLVDRMAHKTRKEYKSEDTSEVTILKDRVAKLEEMLTKALKGGNNGRVV